MVRKENAVVAAYNIEKKKEMTIKEKEIARKL